MGIIHDAAFRNLKVPPRVRQVVDVAYRDWKFLDGFKQAVEIEQNFMLSIRADGRDFRTRMHLTS